MALPTLLDIAKRNGSDAEVGLIEEASRAHPEIQIIPVRTIKGVHYKTRVRTAVPSVSFRAANEGTAVGKSTWENRLVECYMLTPPFMVDKEVADAAEDGPEAYLAEEAAGILEGAMQTLCKQFYYGNVAGNGGDTKGFPGLIDMYDATNMVVDAGGTTASTGSSVWLVRTGVQHVRWVLGNDGELRLSDVKEVVLNDASGNPLTYYHQELPARPGLQVGSLYSVCRIKKITADSGKTLTDSLIYSALSKFPAGMGPDAIFMSRRSLYQLRNSRTATNATGAPAPVPREVEGIPIYVTDAIVDTEALTL